MTAVLRAEGLGKRYRRRWALSDCTLEIPAGHVTGLVGPNGAGKTTLLSLAVGLLAPTVGHHRGVRRPSRCRRGAARQGRLRGPGHADVPGPQHRRPPAAGCPTNPRWDDAVARSRVERLGLDPAQKAGRLSGGQRAQLALTLGLAKRPELLILDEPVASLDPLARREFLQVLMEAVAEHEVSVLLSSHVVSDLERVCDHLVVLVDSQVRVEGDVESLLDGHLRLTGPRRDLGTLPADQHVVSASHTDRQSTLVVRTDAPVLDPSWTVGRLGLEDLVLAYMEGTRAVAPGPVMEVLR